MKTRRKNRKRAGRQPGVNRSSKPSRRRIDADEFEAEEKLAETHFIVDEDWTPPKKSKGADEEL